jgi:hypothetical protein
MNILEELGLDAEDVEWQDLARCQNLAGRYVIDGKEVLVDPLFDSYEDDEAPFPVRKSTDEMCLSCPVQQMCYEYGKRNRESGVWGGVYMVNGKMDRTRNEHKTPDTWAEIRERIGRL